MAVKKTPAQVYARMIEIGYVDFAVGKAGIEWGEPARASYDDECIALKHWVRKNYAAFAAYLKSLPKTDAPA